MGNRFTRSSGAIVDARFYRGRAFRDGELVCEQIVLAVVSDGRLGLAPWERHYTTVRFLRGIELGLRNELVGVLRSRGARSKRLAERVEPIDLVVEDRGEECELRGRLEPPVVRSAWIEQVDFRLRVPARYASRLGGLEASSSANH